MRIKDNVSLFAMVLALVFSVSACGKESFPTTPSESLPSPSSSSCSYNVSPTTASFPAAGGNGSITLTTSSNCAWSSRSNVGWITGLATSSSGSGNAVLPYTVAPNSTTSSRTGTLTIAGRTVTITQSGSVFFEIKGNYTFRLFNMPPGCGWPVNIFNWPVVVEVSSYLNGNTTGTIVFPPYPPAFQPVTPRWDIWAGPGGTRLSVTRGPGFNGFYYVSIDGVPLAGAPMRASDSRGEILDGEVRGSLILILYNSRWLIDKIWDDCGSANWSLRIR